MQMTKDLIVHMCVLFLALEYGRHSVALTSSPVSQKYLPRDKADVTNIESACFISQLTPFSAPLCLSDRDLSNEFVSVQLCAQLRRRHRSPDGDHRRR